MTWTGFPRILLQGLPDDTALKGFLVDSYRIHSSTIVTAALGDYLAGKIVVHFLPPYCPDDNRIERVWQGLHANGTRNHRCPDMVSLMREVRTYLRKRNR